MIKETFRMALNAAKAKQCKNPLVRQLKLTAIK